jgi:hypothetical protein
MRARLRAMAPVDCPIVALLDGRLLAWGALWAVLSLVAFGLVTAIIPNPVFGRQVPPEPFAIWVWLLSAPLMGLVLATYTVPYPASPAATPLRFVDAPDPVAEAKRGTTLGTIGGFGAFLAIGCPVCNKIALVLLGASGAMTVYAPIQPFIGAASLALLVATLVWRLRIRARGGACAA